MSDFFRILRGLEIDRTTKYLTGSGAPGSTADTDGALVGSFYTRTDTGDIYSKYLAGAGTNKWQVYTPEVLYDENPVSPTSPVATGDNAVAIGDGATATNTNSIAIGHAAVASGVDSVALGSEVEASADYSTALGRQSLSRFYGSVATAGGDFTNEGDAQTIVCTMRNITTNNVPVELYLDGSSARLVLPDNSAWTFQMLIIARRTDATGGQAGFRISGTIRRDVGAGTTVLLGSRTKTVEGRTDASWDADVSADTGNGSLQVTVNGQNGKTVRWVASVAIAEVLN